MKEATEREKRFLSYFPKIPNVLALYLMYQRRLCAHFTVTCSPIYQISERKFSHQQFSSGSVPTHGLSSRRFSIDAITFSTIAFAPPILSENPLRRRSLGELLLALCTRTADCEIITKSERPSSDFQIQDELSVQLTCNRGTRKPQIFLIDFLVVCYRCVNNFYRI